MEGDLVPFRILSLPYLARKQVISSMELLEQIDFSICSRKCKSLVKSLTIKDKYKLWVFFNGFCRISIWDDENEEEEMFEKRNWILHGDRDNLEVIEWMIKWVDYICDVLKCSIDWAVVDKIYCFEYFQKIFDWFKDCHPTVSRFELVSFFYDQQAIPNEEFSLFLENIKITKFLKLSIKNNPEFQHNIRLETKKVYILNSEWLTMNHLLASTCTKIELEYSNFTNEELNLFLKQWISGRAPNLCFFSTEIKNSNLQSIISGLEVTEREQNVFYKSNCLVGESSYFKGGFDIRRIDGLIAAINILPHGDPSRNFRPYHEEGSMVFRMVESSQLEPIV